jgi:hypothetical protein
MSGRERKQGKDAMESETRGFVIDTKRVGERGTKKERRPTTTARTA